MSPNAGRMLAGQPAGSQRWSFGIPGCNAFLEPGKLADLDVLDANPLENIRNTESVHYTVVNGRIFDAATMNEVGNHPHTRRPFYFEQPGNEGWGRTTAAATEDEQ